MSTTATPASPVTPATPVNTEALALEPGEIELLSAELGALTATLRDPAARARYLDLAREVESGEVGPERLGDLVEKEIARWNRVVATAGIRE